MTAKEILKKYWNYDSFRDTQEEIIQAVLNKKNVVALLPTGGGKSLCFQIPALVNKGVCIVVSPLIALMQDQVLNLKKRGIKAIAITSKLTESEIVIAFDNMQFGKIKFLYLSPEKLQSEFIQQKIKQLNVNLVAVDEAHCISEWGHDFRVSYLKIALLKKLLPNVNFIALTATATDLVVKDIAENLQLENPVFFKKSFYRDNLAYQIYQAEDFNYQLKRMLSKINQPTIIYVNSRRQTKSLSDYLNTQNFRSSYYNGGMTSDEKEQSYLKWMQEKTTIMVATNAFGMGIDKENVQLIIHLNIPNSIENYMQEAGRAGRNGKKSFAVLLYNKGTIYDFEKRIDQNVVSVPFLKEVYNKLNQFFRIALGELTEKKYILNLQEFCNLYKFNFLKTYNAILLLEKEGVLLYEQNFYLKNAVTFISTNETIAAYSEKKPKNQKIIASLLRSYGGIFENQTYIDEYALSQKIGISKNKLVAQLIQLHQDKIIQYQRQKNSSAIQFLVMREDNRTINSIAKSVTKRNALKIAKKDAILNFVTNKTTCRNMLLLQYFNETKSRNCKICDVCLDKKKQQTNTQLIQQKIEFLLANKTPLDAKEIVHLSGFKQSEVLEVLQFMLENNQLKINHSNAYEKK